MTRKFLFLALLASGVLCAQYQQVSYEIGPGDLIKLSVLDLAEMDHEYRVDTLGFINMQYLGRVEVAGKTVTQLQALISERLKERYLNDPQVLVEIKEFNARPISVIGAVQNPGRLKTADLNMDLIEALTLAGGVLPTASDRILVMRKSPRGINETLVISREDLMINGESYLNIPILPGDTINIPIERPFLVSVIGEVNKPGEYKFSRDGKVTILRVIAAAGGLTDYAKRAKIIVKRDTENGSREFRLNVRAIEESREVNFEMAHNDVVIVP